MCIRDRFPVVGSMDKLLTLKRFSPLRPVAVLLLHSLFFLVKFAFATRLDGLFWFVTFVCKVPSYPVVLFSSLTSNDMEMKVISQFDCCDIFELSHQIFCFGSLVFLDYNLILKTRYRRGRLARMTSRMRTIIWEIGSAHAYYTFRCLYKDTGKCERRAQTIIGQIIAKKDKTIFQKVAQFCKYCFCYLVTVFFYHKTSRCRLNMSIILKFKIE